MSRVLVFGGAVMDFVPVGEGWQARPGGSAWTVTLALAGLGERAAFAGTLGSDAFADTLARQGRAAGLDLSAAARVDAPTALSVVHPPVDGGPARYAFYAQGAADPLFAGVPEEAWEGAQAAYFGGVTLLRPPADRAFLRSAEAAARRGLTVLFDPNYRPAYAEAGRRALCEFLPLVQLLKVSEEDVAGLLPGLDLEAGVAELRRLNPRLTILLTLGAVGGRLITPHGTWTHPGYRVPVADTVGAGDASAAGWLRAAALWPQAPPGDHLAFALACGALACTRPGAHAPTLEAVRRLQTEQQLVAEQRFQEDTP